MLTPMPDCPESVISKIEENLKKIKPISQLLEEKEEILEIAKLVTGDAQIKPIEENIIPVYECSCSRDVYKRQGMKKNYFIKQ